MHNVFSCTTTKMLKYLILAILGTTVSAQAQVQCCDRRAPECQSQYSMCMSSTSADLQQRCESVFCASAPYPLPTTCCDQKQPDCQAKYQECLVGTFGSFSLCAPTFCSSSNEPSRVPSPEFTKLPEPTRIVEQSTKVPEQPTPPPTRLPEMPTPAPTRIVDQPTPPPTRLPEMPTPAPTRIVEQPTPAPTRIVDQPTPAPTRIVEQPTPPPTRLPEMPTRIPELPTISCCNRTTPVCQMAYSKCKEEGGMFCESMFCDGPPMPSLPPTDFTCCDREIEMCKKLHASCVSSGGVMCDLMFCERTPLPLPSRKPKPSPRFSAFPSPKFLRAIPSILPKEIQSSLKVTVKERKEIENVTKIREIQVKISCSLHMPLDNIKIKNITFIDASGIRNVIKFNEIDIDNADIPQVDCFAPQTNARMLQTSNVDIGYIVVDPTPELLAYDPVNLVSSVSNAQPSSTPTSTSQQTSSNNLATVLASVFGGALTVIGIVALVSYIRHKNKPKPIQRQERVIRVSVNPLEAVTALPRAESSRRQFGPQGSRV